MMRLFAFITILLFPFLMNGQGELNEGVCYSEVSRLQEGYDTTYLMYYILKKEFENEKIKRKRKKLILNPNLDYQLNGLHLDVDSTLWSLEVFDHDTLYYNTVKRPNKVEAYKLDTVFLEKVSYRFKTEDWVPVVCSNRMYHNLLYAVVEVLFENGYVEKGPKGLSISELKNIALRSFSEYQKKHNLKLAFLSYETLEHMGIEKGIYSGWK